MPRARMHSTRGTGAAMQAVNESRLGRRSDLSSLLCGETRATTAYPEAEPANLSQLALCMYNTLRKVSLEYAVSLRSRFPFSH